MRDHSLGRDYWPQAVKGETGVNHGGVQSRPIPPWKKQLSPDSCEPIAYFEQRVQDLCEVAKQKQSSVLILKASKHGQLIGARLGGFSYGNTQKFPVSHIVVVLDSGTGIPTSMKAAMSRIEKSEDFTKYHSSGCVRIADMCQDHTLEPHVQLMAILLEHDRGNLVDTIFATRDPVAPQASVCNRTGLSATDRAIRDRCVYELNRFLFDFNSATHVIGSEDTVETNWCFEL